MTTFTARAMEAVNRGLSVVPVKPRAKAPLAKNGAKSRVNTAAGVRQFAVQVPEDANYGICSDERFTILETDNRARLTELLGRPVPPTLCVSARPNRGYWVFAQTPKTLAVKKSPTLGGVFEWRHINQYCVGFGSIHPETQAEYRLASDVEPTPMPDWLVDKLLALSTSANRTPASPIKDEIGPFTKDNTEQLLEKLKDRNPKFDFTPGRTSVGPGWHVTCWNEDEHTEKSAELTSSTVVWVNARGFADAHCSHSHCSSYGWKEFKSNWGISDLQSEITKPGLVYGGGNSEATQKFLDEVNAAETSNQALPFFSDQSLAEGFTRSYSEQLAYLDCGKWATYQDGLWQKDENDLAANHRTGEFLTGVVLPQVDKRVSDTKQNGSLKSRLCSASTQANVVKLARQRPAIFHKLEEFDNDEFLIGAPNGKAIDLRTGETRSATPADRIMKSVSVEPSSEPCPRWEKFVDEITNGDAELASYLQRMSGSWLTASPKDHTLAVWHGSGCNGKGTFIGVAQDILGPYSTTIPVDSLVTKKSGDTDLGGIAMLCGVRLAVAQEGETARRFNAGLLKTLTGGDRLTGKVLYENKFEFKPSHKLVILTNNKPRVDLDGGIRRRLHLVPFTRSFETVKNVNLKEQLLDEAGSILQWMIEGCLTWQRDGLAPPSSVLNYTHEYFEEADDLKGWIEQNCILDAKAWTSASDLFANWRIFCQEGRVFVGNQKDLTENLVREGFRKGRNSRGDKRGILGLKIRDWGGAIPVN